jgi:hypothetical protein
MLAEMDTQHPPIISSFVLRFVVDPNTGAYRGEIRHVQTSQEMHFDTWQEAVEFIQRFVALETPPDAGV